jgi:hypothetical protein
MKCKLLLAGAITVLIGIGIVFFLRPGRNQSRAAWGSAVLTQDGQIKLLPTNSLYKATVVMNLPKKTTNTSSAPPSPR